MNQAYLLPPALQDWLPEGRLARFVAEEVRVLLEEARRVDAEVDGKYGKGRRGDELPGELGRRETRLRKIREAKAALEQEAREGPEKGKAEVEARLAERARQEQERGRRQLEAEWRLICATHNLLKLFRAEGSPQTA